MAQLVKGLSVVAVHDAGTDFHNAHDTDPNEISATTNNDLVTAARPIVGQSALANDTVAVTTAELKTKILVKADGGAARTKALPSAANLIADLDLSEDGASFEFFVINQDDGDAQTFTTDATVVGAIASPLVVAADTAAHYLIRRTSSTACTLYRL